MDFASSVEVIPVIPCSVTIRPNLVTHSVSFLRIRKITLAFHLIANEKVSLNQSLMAGVPIGIQIAI